MVNTIMVVIIVRITIVFFYKKIYVPIASKLIKVISFGNIYLMAYFLYFNK